jgi:lycopene cyclase domain-containing protein
MKYEYLILMLICLSIPLWQSFNTRWGLKGKFKIALLSISFVAIPYIIWDIWATAEGHWSFNEHYITGIHIGNLPIEEVMFFFVIPFCCLFSWNAFKTLEKRK